MYHRRALFAIALGGFTFSELGLGPLVFPAFGAEFLRSFSR